MRNPSFVRTHRFCPQRFGDEYELGVAYDDKIWRIGFRVRPNLWVSLHISWDPFAGLTLIVDGSRHESADAEDRNYQQFVFDAFMDVTVGLSVDGTPLTSEKRFEIARLTVYDWYTYSPSTDIGNFIVTQSFLILKIIYIYLHHF